MFSAKQKFRHLSSRSKQGVPLGSGSTDSEDKINELDLYPHSLEKFPYKVTKNSNSISPSIKNQEVEENDHHQSEDRRVKFQPTVVVVLIPHVSDYKGAGLLRDLWYADYDICGFKTEAFYEYQELLLSNYRGSEDHSYNLCNESKYSCNNLA
eukprot:CAMPEP_0202961746 /NCGR_PEP_ID=MMETSP1396-20130829/5822_1 /ASSEMBLY_ACC=CAM_ASM_000872 /TAXON_ID= /ORGANISM="Pseudokeronopsis sp., Strain Brazil" /LENGTH=152 /DNA_ID=CAMNT_0049681807 /DNA_START=36 /DNA_END=494 /DNA_ORIENTATION=-